MGFGIVVLVGTLVIGGFFALLRSDKESECPDMLPVVDFSDYSLVEYIYKNETKNMLSRFRVVLTDRGKVLLDVLENMSEDDSEYSDQRRATAKAAMTAIAAYLPRLDDPIQPSRCIYADIVDSTVFAMRNRDRQAMRSVFEKISIAAVDNFKYISQIATFMSGCNHGAFSTVQRYCKDDGREYKMYKLIQLMGPTFVKNFRNVSTQLHFSLNPMDQTLAAIAAASMSPAYRDFLKFHTNEITTRLFQIMLTYRLEEKCCEEYTKEMLELLDREKINARFAAERAYQNFEF